MKNIILLAITLVLVTSCSKDYEQRSVTYFIKGVTKPYTLNYLNEEGATITQTVAPTNINDIWTYKFNGYQGDLVYLNAAFTEDISNMGLELKFQFRILVDGKVYKDAYGYDQNIGDTLFRVKRSGVIPY